MARARRTACARWRRIAGPGANQASAVSVLETFRPAIITRRPVSSRTVMAEPPATWRAYRPNMRPVRAGLDSSSTSIAREVAILSPTG